MDTPPLYYVLPLLICVKHATSGLNAFGIVIHVTSPKPKLFHTFLIQ
jgi:hypothetical protein